MTVREHVKAIQRLLARELGIGQRTVYRYLAALKDEGVPVRRMNPERAA